MPVVRRETPEPLLIHAGEVVLVRHHNGDAYDLVHAAPGFLEDRLDVGQALTGLLLDRGALERASGWIRGRCARDEDQPGCLNRLAVSRGGVGCFGGVNDLPDHFDSFEI